PRHTAVRSGAGRRYRARGGSGHVRPELEEMARPMPKRVLICDDEPYIVESVSYVVRKAGFDVVTAEDGEQALEAAHREKPDLVFLDIMMPGISGDEVCRRLKADPSTRATHVVILTARGQEEDERRAMEMG